jgi:hypothetical protein
LFKQSFPPKTLRESLRSSAPLRYLFSESA